MKKKVALLVSVLLFFILSFPFVYDLEIPDEAGSLEAGAFAGEVRQAEKLQQTLAKTLDTEQITLCFRGEALACDRDSLTWYLPVNMDETAWEAGSFSTEDSHLQVLPLQDYTLLDKQSVVSKGQEIPFLIWSEKEGSCAVAYVVFTGLPVINMETESDIDSIPAFAGRIVFYESCEKQDWTLVTAFEAHERGQTTRAYPKKGYRVNLISVLPNGTTKKNSEKILGMRDSDSWIFYAIYSDGTKVRDKFNTELWNQFGAVSTPYDAHFGTHMEYAELIVNGEYRGLYGILEPIDTDQLQISDQEYLYKRTYGRELLSELFWESKPEEYLTTLGMEIKGKEGAGTAADWECFRSFVELCEEDDESFARDAGKLLDLDNVADIWIYLQMSYAEDNIYKNMFFAFKKEAAGYRLYLVPWDTDLTWGNSYVEDKEQLYCVFTPKTAGEYLEWPLADRLISLNVGNIREKIRSRWKELRAGILSEETMKDVLDLAIHQVQDSGAFAREAARWPKSRCDGEYEQMQTYMRERMKFLDDFLNNPDEWIQN